MSCTITFDPETEGQHLAHALDYFQYQLKGVSFLPRMEYGAFPQVRNNAFVAHNQGLFSRTVSHDLGRKRQPLARGLSHYLQTLIAGAAAGPDDRAHADAVRSYHRGAVQKGDSQSAEVGFCATTRGQSTRPRQRPSRSAGGGDA